MNADEEEEKGSKKPTARRSSHAIILALPKRQNYLETAAMASSRITFSYLVSLHLLEMTY